MAYSHSVRGQEPTYTILLRCESGSNVAAGRRWILPLFWAVRVSIFLEIGISIPYKGSHLSSHFQCRCIWNSVSMMPVLRFIQRTIPWAHMWLRWRDYGSHIIRIWPKQPGNQRRFFHLAFFKRLGRAQCVRLRSISVPYVVRMRQKLSGISIFEQNILFWSSVCLTRVVKAALNRRHTNVLVIVCTHLLLLLLLFFLFVYYCSVWYLSVFVDVVTHGFEQIKCANGFSLSLSYVAHAFVSPSASIRNTDIQRKHKSMALSVCVASNPLHLVWFRAARTLFSLSKYLSIHQRKRSTVADCTFPRT